MIDPVLVLGIAADWFAALILTAIWCARREIRGRMLPFGILTLLHATLVLLCLCCNSGAVVRGLRELYFFSPLVLLLFYLIYTIVLSEYTHTRMTRPLKISGFVFCANTIFQGLLTIVVHIGGYTS